MLSAGFTYLKFFTYQMPGDYGVILPSGDSHAYCRTLDVLSPHH